MSDDNACLDCGKERRAGGARGLCKSCYYRRRRRGTLGEHAKRTHSFEEHLATIVPDENGCWLWPGFVNDNGYGVTKKHTAAHVASYEHHIGPVPEKYDVGHACHDKDLDCQDWRTCTHRRCINPDHLVAQTRSENLKARPHRQAHCKRGHELSPENVKINRTSGSRQCQLCVRLLREANRDKRNVRRRAAARQAAIAAQQFTRPVPGMPEPRPTADSPIPGEHRADTR